MPHETTNFTDILGITSIKARRPRLARRLMEPKVPEGAKLFRVRPHGVMGPGRNEPCHCGSRKKFKHCCLGKKVGVIPIAGDTKPVTAGD